VLSSIALYVRTARHLRPVQIADRLARPGRARLARAWLTRRPAVARAEQPRLDALKARVEEWGPSDVAASTMRAAELLEGRLSLLNREIPLDGIDWHGRVHGHLWSYHLHYFDFATDLAWHFRATQDPRVPTLIARLVSDWLARNPLGEGDGWDAFPTSVRIANWVRLRLLLEGDLDDTTARRMDESLARQTGWLRRNLEYHLLGNHLLKNVRGLAFGGAYFGGRAGEAWRDAAFRLLVREAQDQFGSDGVHQERSPMYHALALSDVLEAAGVLAVHGPSLPRPAADRLARGLRFARAMTRSDGSLLLFNDSANGVAPALPYLRRLAAGVLPPAGDDAPCTDGACAAGGFFACRGDGELLVVDGGAPAPAHQPGHAHCGLLAFTLDYEGRPVFVDAGVHGYEHDRFRTYCRSTAAHNTVRLDGKEQSEIWATFRMARRARLRRAELEEGPWKWRGAYSPYHAPGAVHEREIVRHGRGDWQVTDHVRGADGVRLESYLHLHPRFEAWRTDEGVVAKSTDGCTVRIEPFGFDAVEVVRGATEPLQGWYLPEFGRAEAAPAIVMTGLAANGAPTGYSIAVAG
jgi:uncharacterized heparinase superfamily protein